VAQQCVLSYPRVFVLLLAVPVQAQTVTVRDAMGREVGRATRR
jgi:hypothetical protein